MSVSAVGPTGTSGSTAVSSQIASLRKQVAQLNKQLADEVTSADDAKTKELKQQLISQQIMVLEARIAALANQQIERQATASTSQTSAATARARTAQSADGAGRTIDLQL
ncbi:MAG: FlxA-like family protein [Actinobacteria bacterium]|nr:FlxA-like family protein [Actinomycetota bacterium]MCG2801789.1 FlxA-like family protein [Cellulomonas sp.]